MPRLPLADLDSAVSPRRRNCTLWILTPKLKESLTAVSISLSSSSQRVASIVAVNFATSFLPGNTLSYSLSYRSPFRFVSSVLCQTIGCYQYSTALFGSFRMTRSLFKNSFTITWPPDGTASTRLILERVEVTVSLGHLDLSPTGLNIGDICVVNSLPMTRKDSSITDPLGFRYVARCSG